MFCILFKASISEKHETRQIFYQALLCDTDKKKTFNKSWHLCKVCKQIIYNMWKQNLKQTLSMKET